MAGRLKSTLELSIDDHISPAAKRIDQSLANLRQQSQRSQEMFNSHRNTFIATAGAAAAVAWALEKPISASTEYSTLLEDIRQTADLSASTMERLGKSYRQAGLETAQGYDAIAEANKAMVASGAVTPEQAAIMDDFAGRAATAYGTSVVDSALTATSVIQNLGVAVEDTGSIFDRVAMASKFGAVEMPDMAAQFPALTSTAATLEMQGLDAATSLGLWLEIARRAKPTASEAANAMRGFMTSLKMPNTIERFAEDDVDILNELKRAAEAGADPLTHIIGVIAKLTEGNPAALSDYFREEGSLAFISQATKDLEEYKVMLESATNAQGTVDRDFADRMKTPGAINARFWASMSELQLVIGDSLVPSLTRFVTEVTPMIDSLSGFVEANDELVSQMVQTAAALVGLRLLASAGGMANYLLNWTPPVATTASTVAGGAAGSAAVTAGAGGLIAAGKNFLGTAFGKMVGLYAVYELAKAKDEWAPSAVPDFSKSWHENLVEQLDPVLAKMFYEGYNPLTNMHGPSAPAGTLTGGPESEEMAAIRAMLAENDSGLIPLHPIELTALREELAALEAESAAAGNAAGLSLASNFAGQLPGLTADMQAVMSRLRIVAASGVNIPMRINGPTVLPTDRASIAGARASGGSVRGGSTYEINERGQEYFTPGVGGFVHKAGSFSPPGHPTMGGGQGGGGPTVGSQSFAFEIHINNPTNADPATLNRMLGDEIGKTMRRSFSNGGY